LPNNCIAANLQTGACLQCQPNYNNVNGLCTSQATVIVTIQNCQIVNPANSSLCSTCESGYYPNGTQCVPVSPLCQSYNLTNGNCLACISSYTLNQGKCLDLNCLNQQSNGCVQCKNNFRVLGGSSLCVFYDPNCAILTSTSCQTCITGYQISSSAGLCSMSSSTSTVIPNCNIVQNGQCTACVSGYSLSNGQCIVVSGGATVV